MSLILHRNIAPVGEIGIWQIEETEDFFADSLKLSLEEGAQLGAIRGKKRLEWLAARQLVHRMSGKEERSAFLKDEYGKPHLSDTALEVSISHSGNLAAAIMAPVTVGIDIQFPVEKITRIAGKFMSPRELASVSEAEKILHLHVFWGAKESLYKAWGRRGLDFCSHIIVHPFAYNLAEGHCRGEIRKDGVVIFYNIHYEMQEGAMLVYALETRKFVFQK